MRFKARSLSYGEFDARTDELAAGLAELGVRPGEVVSVCCPTASSSSRRGGRSSKPAVCSGRSTPRTPPPRPAYIVGHSEAVALVTDARGAGVLAGAVSCLRSVISIDEGGDVRLDELARRGSSPPGAGAQPRRPRGAPLHLRHDRPAEGRDAHARAISWRTRGSSASRCRSGAATRWAWSCRSSTSTRRWSRRDPAVHRRPGRHVGALLGLAVLGEVAALRAGDLLRRADDARRPAARPGRGRGRDQHAALRDLRRRAALARPVPPLRGEVRGARSWRATG